jgi:hypothetical protein
MKIRPYRWLAEYYDELFLPFRSPIDAARERLLRPIFPGVQSACDLACGTVFAALPGGPLVFYVGASHRLYRGWLVGHTELTASA